ncbi:MAG: DUF167 family protein, partial [Nitrososphaeraceae archaeon]
VYVKFNPRGRVTVEGDEITISLRSRPLRGKANKELVKLANYFRIGKDRIWIVSRRISNKKLVEIDI